MYYIVNNSTICVNKNVQLTSPLLVAWFSYSCFARLILSLCDTISFFHPSSIIQHYSLTMQSEIASRAPVFAFASLVLLAAASTQLTQLLLVLFAFCLQLAGSSSSTCCMLHISHIPHILPANQSIMTLRLRLRFSFLIGKTREAVFTVVACRHGCCCVAGKALIG